MPSSIKTRGGSSSKSGRGNKSGVANKSGGTFTRRNSGGRLAVTLLAASTNTEAYVRKNSNGSDLYSSNYSSSFDRGNSYERRNSLTDLFNEAHGGTETNESSSKPLFSVTSKLSSAKSSLKTKARALSKSLPNERPAALLASYRSRRKVTDEEEEKSVTSFLSLRSDSGERKKEQRYRGISQSAHGTSKSQTSHGKSYTRSNKASHGSTSVGKSAFISPDMKRATSTLSKNPIKRSFTTKLNMSTKEDTSSPLAAATTPMFNFFNSLNHSYLTHLSPETPQNFEKSMTYKQKMGNRHPGRPVYNGHYVKVRPEPLKNPNLVIYSEEMASTLGLSQDVGSEVFLKYFSGDLDYVTTAFSGIGESVSGGFEVESWATPYALSIMGRRYTNNCPYGTGDGYGDGRAISIGEVLIPHKKSNSKALYPKNATRYELQIKGAGQTPFCRGADGRAVLRSSVREFLASEAMHHLGISTTRALSLTVSHPPNGNTSMRPWYSSNGRQVSIPTMSDPRLSQYTDKEKREIISQISAQAKADPDTMVEEKCAMTTRVASSFVRIGHLDLFARRVEMVGGKSENEMDVDVNIKETNEYQELEDMLWHACYREFYEEAYAPFYESKDAKGAALALMEGSMNKIADMVAGWVRVGFVQGNFNADNCLVGGRTMDYGPFGFLDVYHPLSAKWTGSGDHFGFMNQPKAGYANFAVLVESLLPIIDANGGNVDEIRDEMLAKAQKVFSKAVDKTINSKMGVELAPPDMAKDIDALWEDIEPLLRTARGDWTLFWRQLTYVATEFSPTKSSFSDPSASIDYERMLTILLGDENTNPFYDPITDDNRALLLAWIKKWHKCLVCSHKHATSLPNASSIPPPEERMRQANPKFTLREWMLVDAYSKADMGKFIPGDFSLIHDLYKLAKDPYGEGTAEQHEKYYRRAPDESLSAGGTAFMS